MRKTFASCSSLALVALVGAACAASDADSAPPPAGLSVSGAWARPADSGATSAVYFVLHNAGATTDTLSGVRSTLAERTELHVSTQHGSMMHMSQVASLPVPPEDSVMFRPLGAHVMLTGLQRPFLVGDSVRVTLLFGSGQTVDVQAYVRQP